MLSQEIFKFIMVGVVNTFFYYLLYATFIYIGIEYFYAVTLATIIGILFSYKTFSKIVFNSGSNKAFIKFIIVYLLNIALNIFIIKCYLYFNDNLYIAGFIATCLVAVVSFVLNKFYVFKV